MSARLCLLTMAFVLNPDNAVMATPTQSPHANFSVEVVPKEVAQKCQKKSQKTQVLFDLCADQLALLQEAHRLAQESGKRVLVSFGADWCIWCHVFEAHVLGKYGEFTYPTEDGFWTMQEKGKGEIKAQALALHQFVAQNFVIVNIGQQTGDAGLTVLRQTRAEDQFSGGLPFIYVLDQDGKSAGVIKSSDVEIRRDGKDAYRGYDRVKLLAVLQSLRNAEPTPAKD